MSNTYKPALRLPVYDKHDMRFWGFHALSLLQLTLARYEQVQYSISTNYVDPKTNPRHGTHFLQHANHGVLATKNLGLRNARGKTASRVPNALVNILARPRATVIYCMFDHPCALANTTTFAAQVALSPVQLDLQV